MKRTVLFAAAAVVAFGSGFSGARAFVSSKPMVQVALEEGDSCTTENGRSGYMVSSGRGLECREIGGA